MVSANADGPVVNCSRGASLRFRSMGMGKVRVRALVVSIDAGGLMLKCPSEASLRFRLMWFARD